MPDTITASDLRAKYLEFFGQRGHAVIPSASLVPANDPTVLFTTAGMHPLVPHLLGEPHPAGQRLVNVQRCVRTGDIDVIGDDTHLTFFEMLGNWSLGDYFRDDAIRWSFEFLTDPRWLALPIERLGVTCFAGDDHVERDEESARLWATLGIPSERIGFLGREDNWWGPAGSSGPCGPDTEIFFWVGTEPAPRQIDLADNRWVEIWNNVFMGYTQTASGAIEPLARVNVDTGMGLERTLVALNGLRSVYEIDTVRLLADTLRALVTRPLPDGEQKLRVVIDHARAAAFLIADGIGPSNKDRGYVVRRLLRRCILFARQLGMPADWYRSAIASLEQIFAATHLHLGDVAMITDTIAQEVAKFERTLEVGLRLIGKRPVLDGHVAFDLFQTYGFPFELTRELAAASGKPIDEAAFRELVEQHRQRSRTSSAGSFEGGLADHSVEIVRYHTITHLLQAALRSVLGEHVLQRGSNITRERLRFDFSHPQKVTPDQLTQIQTLINRWLGHTLRVDRATMSEAEARSLGAIGAFGEKYGEIVSVYTITDADTSTVVSREMCGGPHAPNLQGLAGTFRILREEAVSAGVRRIKAILD